MKIVVPVSCFCFALHHGITETKRLHLFVTFIVYDVLENPTAKKRSSKLRQFIEEWLECICLHRTA